MDVPEQVQVATHQDQVEGPLVADLELCHGLPVGAEHTELEVGVDVRLE
jgi:hypothetical protein